MGIEILKKTKHAHHLTHVKNINSYEHLKKNILEELAEEALKEIRAEMVTPSEITRFDP